MPYTVALPDGRVVEFPDNVPPDKAAEILRQQFPTPSAPSSLGDILSSFGRGAAGSTKALTDVFGADNAVSGKLEEASKALEAGMSPARRAELQRQAERSKRAAESGSVWEEIKAAAQNIGEAPLQAAAEGLGSFVPYIPALFASPAAAAIGLGARGMAAVNTVAKYAPRVIGTGQGVGSVKGSIYDAVYEAERKDGASEAEAKAKALKSQEYFGGNIDQIVLGGGLGYLAGSSGIERLLTKEGVEKAAPGMLRRVATSLAEEVPTEALQGGQEAFAGNLALQRTGRDQPLFQGVAGQAAQEGLTAALSAGPMAAVRSPASFLEEQDRAKRAQEQIAAQRQAEEDAAKQAQFRQTPAYLDDVNARYQKFVADMQALSERAKVKVNKNEDPAGYADQQAAIKERRDLLEANQGLTEEYRQAKPQLLARQAQQQRETARAEAMKQPGAQADLLGEKVTQTDASPLSQARELFPQVQSLQKDYDAAMKAGDLRQAQLIQNRLDPLRSQMQSLVPSADELSDTRTRLNDLLDESRAKIQTMRDEDARASDMLRESERRDQLEKALAELEQYEKFAAPSTRANTPEQVQAKIKSLSKKAQKLIDAGDSATEVLKQIAELEAQPGLFSGENYAALHAQAEGLGQEIGQERERRAAQQKLVALETEALRRISERGPQRSPVEQAIYEQKLEQARKDMRRLTTERLLRQRLAKLDPNSDDAKKTQARLDALFPPNEQRELSPDRLELVDTLSKELAALEKAKSEAPEGQQGLFDNQIESTKQALGEVQQRVERGDRYRDTTQVADNLLADERDRRVDEILEKLLPKAIVPGQTSADKMNQRAKLVAKQKQAQSDMEKALDGLMFMYRNNSGTQQDVAYVSSLKKQYFEASTALVNLTREIERGPELTPEAKGELREQLMDVMEFLTTDPDERSDSEKANPQAFLDSIGERHRRIVERFSKVIPEDTSAKRAKGQGLVGQDVLNQYKESQQLLKAVNEQIKKAGNPKAPEKAAARQTLVGLRDRLRTELSNLQSAYNRLSAQGQRTPEESTEVDDMRRQLAAIENQLRNLTVSSERGNIRAQLQGARDELIAKLEAATGPQRPEQDETPSKTLPGMGQRFGQFQFKPTDPADIINAKTAFVNAENLVEKLKNALQKTTAGPQYFAEMAAKLKAEIKAFEAERERDDKNIVLQRLIPAYAQKRKDITKFENLAKLAATKDDLRPQLQKMLEAAQADVEKKREAITALEKRQRQYEQQEAAKQGRTVSESEARKIQAGDTSGYVSPKGKRLGKPRKLESWNIDKQSKAQPSSANALAKAGVSLAEARLLVNRLRSKNFDLSLKARQASLTPEEFAAKKARAKALEEFIKNPPEKAGAERIAGAREQLALLNKEIASQSALDIPAELRESIAELKEALDANFTDEQALAFADEIARLNAALGSGGKAAATKIQRAYDATKTAAKPREALLEFSRTLVFAEKEAEADFRRLQKQADQINEKYTQARKAIDDMTAETPSIQFAVNQNRMVQAETAMEGMAKSLRKAEVAYLEARRDLMLGQYTLGKDLRAQYMEQTQELADRSKGVEEIQKQAEAARKAQAETEALLKKAEDLLASKQAQLDKANEKNAAELNRPRIEGQEDTTSALDAAAAERERLEKAKRGEGIPGVRYERDTAGPLATAAQNDFKRQIAETETNLAKAIAEKDEKRVQELNKKLEQLHKDLASVYGSAPVKVTDLADDGTDAFGELVQPKKEAKQPEPEEGMRLKGRKQGPLVRNLSGSKKLQQSGKIRLHASGLSQSDANAVALFNYSTQLAAAKTDAKRKSLQAKYDNATKDLTPEQIKEQIARGDELSQMGPSLDVIAKRLQYREAIEAESRAKADLDKAKDPDVKALAESVFDDAQRASDAAERAYKLALEREQNKTKGKKRKSAAEEIADTLDEDVAEDTSIPELDAADAAEANYLLGGQEDLFGTTYADMSANEASEEVVEALKDGRLGDALDLIAAKGANDLLRRNAAAIRQFAFRTKVKFVPNLMLDGQPVPALYSARDNTVYMNADGSVMQEDVVHEATHAVTLYALKLPNDKLTKEQQVARNELTAMWRTLSKDKALADQYGMSSLEEFASEMQSNDAFRKAIGDRKWRGESFVQKAIRLLLEVLGLRRSELLTDKAEQYINDLYMQSRKFTAESLGTASRNSVLVADDVSKYGTLKANLFGLGGRVQYVDSLAAADAAFVRAQKEGNLSSLEAENAQYFMRLADNVTQAAGQFITSGPVRLVKDKIGNSVEERYESTSGTNLVDTAQSIEDAAKAGLGTPQEVETMLTALIAGDRANATPNGWQRLAGDKAAAAKAEYDSYQRRVDANPAAKAYIDKAKADYKKYNNGLMDLVEQTGFLSKAEADDLRSKPYVPFYRVVKDEVRLYVDSAKWVRIGDLKNNPDLKQLVGSSEKIMPILTSAVQNTFMLSRAAMQNKGTHETASALFKAGFASKFGPGRGPDSPSTVRFKVKGQDYFALIDSDAFGIPADLIVRGMEGMKVATPEIVKMMGIPANWVRKFVTRSPAYVFRQIVREPLQAAITQGVNGVPVLNALKQMAKMGAGKNQSEDALMRGLVVSSNIFSGDEQDMQMFLRDVSTGKGKWDKMLAALDSVALKSDAATRALIYEDSIKKGLSPRQAQFRALESQNFSRRGLSPSMQMARVIIPFFNAQIQGLDVLYRALRGRLPFEEKLKLRDKMVKRGLLLATTALGYALMMREDEKYRDLPPEVRYNNFLFKLPGGKDYLKVPIPYEIGILFKALPEAMLDAATTDTKASEAAMGIGKLLWQSAPGVVPVAVKPWVEAALNQTAYGPVEDRRMQQLPTAQRYDETTPEVLKTLGGLTSAVGVSPKLLEHFANAYGSSLLLSILRIPDGLLRDKSEGEEATLPISKTAFFGGMFQSEDGRFAIDRAYSEMQKIEQAVKGYEDLITRGRRAEAEAFAQNKAAQLDMGSMAGTFRQRMGEMFKAERAIRIAPDLTTAQKDAMIAEIKENQRREAREFYAATQTKPQ